MRVRLSRPIEANAGDLQADTCLSSCTCTRDTMGWVTVGCCGVVLAATFQRHFKVVVSCKALWPTDAPVVQPGSTADVLDLVSPLHGLLEAEEVFFADVVARVPKCAVERDVRAEHAPRGRKWAAPRGDDAVVLWLEASGALSSGPIAEVFTRLRELYNLLPSLRSNPHVSTLSQSELAYLFTTVSGECDHRLHVSHVVRRALPQRSR